MDKIKEIKIKKELKLWMLNQPLKISYSNIGMEYRRPTTNREVAKMLGVSEMTWGRWLKTGKISPYYLRLLVEKGIL